MNAMADGGNSTRRVADEDASQPLDSYEEPPEGEGESEWEREYVGAPRAAVYLWTVRKGKAGRRLLKAQEDELRAYCERNGYEVTEVLSDEGSTPLCDRGGIAVLRDWQRVWRVFDRVVVRAPDRFSRDAEEIRAFMEEMDNAGAPVEFVHHPRRSTTLP